MKFRALVSQKIDQAWADVAYWTDLSQQYEELMSEQPNVEKRVAFVLKNKPGAFDRNQILLSTYWSWFDGAESAEDIQAATPSSTILRVRRNFKEIPKTTGRGPSKYS